MKFYILQIIWGFVFLLGIPVLSQGDIDSLLIEINTSKNDTVLANAHYKLAWELKLSKLKDALAHNDSALVGFKNLKLNKKIALTHFQYSVFHRLAGDYNNALESLTKYQKFTEAVKDTSNLTYAHYEKGVIYTQKGDYEIGLEEFYKAYNLAETTKNSYMLGMISNSIGIVYNDLEKYDQAIEILNQSLKIIREVNNGIPEHLSDIYNSLGVSYKGLNDFDKSLEFLDKAIAVSIESKSDYGLGVSSLGKGIIYIEQKRFKEALPLLEKAYKIQKENNYATELVLSLTNLGKTHFELGNYDLSEYYLNEGVNQKVESKQSAQDLYFELYRTHQNKGNFRKALKYHETYLVYKDSVYDDKNIKSVNLLQKEFETAKKDKELAQQQLAIEQQDLKLEKQQSQTKLMTGLVVFLLLTSLLTWFLYQQRQKRKDQEIVNLKREQQVKTLELLMEGEEKERFRIAKELHDGVNVDLSSIKYKLTSLLEKNNEVINEAVAMIDKSCEQVRAISHDLVPPSLKDFSLTDAIKDFCVTKNNLHQETIICNTIGLEITISKKAQINIFRVVQELVNNSIKHANASEIDVQISFQKSLIQVTVEDNGKGFNKDEVERSGIGLQNINSRVEYLNAKLDFTSDSKGTSYVIDINTDELI